MLLACPKCQRTYPAEGSTFCPHDGERLLPIDDVTPVRDAKDPLVTSTVAGRFELRRVIANGGMGRVYEAREVTRQERVAVKILHADVAEDEVNIERFRREATTSQALDHPHVVKVMEFAATAQLPGRPGKSWFLVMEYLDGEELRHVLTREKTIPVHRALRIVSQLALALDSAHARGFVHRDLKPDNVFLVRGPDGDTVKLLDFGSVKFTKGQDRGQKLTVMGTTIGSPFYMSPEQAQGSPDLDQRTDVWAVAVIVYEMFVGKVPFFAGNGAQILFKILGDEAMPPTFANDSAPPQLDDLLHKALRKDPNLRFQSAGEFAAAFGHAFGLSGEPATWAAMSEHALHDALAAAAEAPPPPAPVVGAPVVEAPPVVAAPPPPPMAWEPTPAAPAPTWSPRAAMASSPPTARRATPAWVFLAVLLGVLALGAVAFFAMK
jgi:tRNA A-37 threonylcarbamoyl transferase component Bud32